MTNPYLLDLPAVVNFSGGRSSGFMLYKIWEAFDFNWPDNCAVIFNNTGHEHPETYNFIHRVSEKWKEANSNKKQDIESAKVIDAVEASPEEVLAS